MEIIVVANFLDVWRFNSLFCSPIFNISEDMRLLKHMGTGKEGTDANLWNLALCSISTQRTFSVRVLHNPRRSNIMIGVVHLTNLFQIGGFQMAYQYKLSTHEMPRS